MIDRETGKSPILVFCGIVLLAIVIPGVVYGFRASMAYTIYHHVKYGSADVYGPRAVARRCEDAHRLYPYNYYLCIWTAEKCWYERLVDGEESSEHINLARVWCNRGLLLNKRKSQLRLLKSRLLAGESLDEAIINWEDYVKWHFWDPYNHAVLVKYYAEVGDFAGAVESLKWVKNSKHYTEAHLAIQTAWEKEMRSAPDVSKK